MSRHSPVGEYTAAIYHIIQIAAPFQKVRRKKSQNVIKWKLYVFLCSYNLGLFNEGEEDEKAEQNK